MLHVRFQDVLRATLPLRSGNEGWIGVSPTGGDYHVVVPVDVQIARGVMACNRPTDGTPFGGYSGWLYFRCPPYEDAGVDDEELRAIQARRTGAALIAWLGAHGIEAALVEESSCGSQRAADADSPPVREQSPEPGGSTYLSGSPVRSDQAASSKEARGVCVRCPGCGKAWTSMVRFLGDPETWLARYKACLDDFSLGEYLFAHECGATIDIAVSRLARGRRGSRSLIGTHACPGLCYYDSSLAPCDAECEGACYRRIAGKLRSHIKLRSTK